MKVIFTVRMHNFKIFSENKTITSYSFSLLLRGLRIVLVAKHERPMLHSGLRTPREGCSGWSIPEGPSEDASFPSALHPHVPAPSEATRASGHRATLPRAHLISARHLHFDGALWKTNPFQRAFLEKELFLKS